MVAPACLVPLWVHWPLFVQAWPGLRLCCWGFRSVMGRRHSEAKQSGHAGPCLLLSCAVPGSHCPSLSLSVLIHTVGRILPSSHHMVKSYAEVSYVSPDTGSLGWGDSRRYWEGAPCVGSIWGQRELEGLSATQGTRPLPTYPGPSCWGFRGASLTRDFMRMRTGLLRDACPIRWSRSCIQFIVVTQT